MLELKEVWKHYPIEKVIALRGINFKVHEGDFIAIMGPSGSGKSTLMNIMGLLDMPTKGKLYLDNEDVSKFSDDRLAEIRGKKIGFIFQMFNLIPTLTVLENVLLPNIFLGVDSTQKQKAVDILKSLGIGERVNHLPGQLSGGERQRAAIARSLINNPELILADEPTGNLDSKTGAQIMKLLEDLHHKGKTIVVITHDPRIASFAHETVNIIDGELTHNHLKSKQYIWRKK